MSDTPIYIVGSGLAGLLSAILLAESRPVVVLTKKTLKDSSTEQSQGGMAAVWSKKDNIDLHIKDTLKAGKGLNDLKAIELLSYHSKEAVQLLVDLGVNFDRNPDGTDYHLAMEGAHSTHRVLHSGGDATGTEIQRALNLAATDHPNITIRENTSLAEIQSKDGILTGISYYVGESDLHSVDCSQLILGTGGVGQLYRYTSNPITATGEGMVLAYMAGAELADLEFIQFHPTALNLKGAPNFLITEAMRGEGAILKNQRGEDLMAALHPDKDLAPRDIVSRAIFQEMKQGPVCLDARHLGEETIKLRFPTIYKTCLGYGIDITKDMIPVAPVAHYIMGGIVTDLMGRSRVKGLYVAGEAARTGVHGANRLASNSLLEGAIFAMQVSKSLVHDQAETPEIWKSPIDNCPKMEGPFQENPISRKDFTKLMWNNVGIVRNHESLSHCIHELGNPPCLPAKELTQPELEFQNMRILGKLIAEAALKRTTSIGGHYRTDSL